MGLFSNRVERSDIVAGDHIYTWRLGGIFSHHGIYIGKGLVIHFTKPPEKLTASSPSSASSAPGRGEQRTCPNHPHCGRRKPGSGVAITCLDCFIEEGSLYRYEYGVSFLHRYRGTGAAEQSDPASKVVWRAKYLFENGFRNYHLVRNNCEDFALYCKTEILVLNQVVGKSGQVASALRAMSPFIAFIVSLFQNDGTKVPVEKVNKKIKVPVENMDDFFMNEFGAGLIPATFPPIY